MRRAAMYGMIGALSLTFGTIVIPSENFIRLNTKGLEDSVIPAVTRELEADTAKVPEDTNVADDTSKVQQAAAADKTPDTTVATDANTSQAVTCPHTDGNHTSDCPYYTGGTGGYDCGHTDGNHTADCPYWDGNCGHTDGNHPTDCPNWSSSQGNSGSGSSSSYGGHHGGGHHGGGHH